MDRFVRELLLRISGVAALRPNGPIKARVLLSAVYERTALCF